MWYGENGKVSAVKKKKKKDTRTTWFETSTATVPRQRRQGILNANRIIRKRTVTDVAFTHQNTRGILSTWMNN